MKRAPSILARSKRVQEEGAEGSNDCAGEQIGNPSARSMLFCQPSPSLDDPENDHNDSSDEKNVPVLTSPLHRQSTFPVPPQYAPRQFHSATAGKFKLRHYRFVEEQPENGLLPFLLPNSVAQGKTRRHKTNYGFEKARMNSALLEQSDTRRDGQWRTA